MKNNVVLQDKCKFVRNNRGITQRQMACLIGTNQTEVSFIERGFIPEDKSKIYAIENLYEEEKCKKKIKMEIF